MNYSPPSPRACATTNHLTSVRRPIEFVNQMLKPPDAQLDIVEPGYAAVEIGAPAVRIPAQHLQTPKHHSQMAPRQVGEFGDIRLGGWRSGSHGRSLRSCGKFNRFGR